MVTTVQRKPRPPQEPPSSLSKWHDPKKMRQRGGIFKPSAENPLIDLLLAIPKRPAAGPGSNRRTPRSKTPRRRVVGSGDRGGHETTTANYQPPSSPLLNKSAAKGKARKSKASLSRRRSTKRAEELDLVEAAANDEDVFESGGGDVGGQTARGKARKSKASLLRRRSTIRAEEMDLAEAAANDEDVFESGGGDVGGQSDAETDNEPLMKSTRRTPGRKQAQPRSDENQPVAPTNAVRRRSSKKFKELAPETSDPPIAVVDLQSSVRSRKHRQLSPIAESSLASPAPPPLKTKLSTAASRPHGKADPVTKTKALGKRKTQDEEDFFELGSPAKRPRTDTGSTRQTPSRAAKHLQFFEQEDSPPAPAPPPTKSVKAKPSTTAQKSKASSSKSAATGKKSQALAVAEQVDADAEDLPSVKAKPSTKKGAKAKDITLEAGGDEEHVHEAENIPPETKSAAAPTKTTSKHTTTDGEGALDNSIHPAAASGSNAKQPSAKALGKRKAEEAILPEDEREAEAPKPKGKKSASKQPKRPKNPAPATKRKPRGQKATTTRKKRKVEPETDEEDEKDFVDVVVKTKTGDDESSEDEKKGGKGKKTGGSKSKGKVKQASAKRKLPPPRPSMFVKAEAAYLDSEADPMDLLG
ncbi:hypothetical protein FRC04_002227 [Tulasnella sp. 424]|nr:hypothetical protein FRC04_002227 [Tulasnella sp. 424]KAG8969704.1 hypothetical protein FRC05_000835 [Tulasnella sp. 425]